LATQSPDNIGDFGGSGPCFLAVTMDFRPKVPPIGLPGLEIIEEGAAGALSLKLKELKLEYNLSAF